MYLQKNSEKKWLIKSENEILGPYSFDQILDLLRKKQISIIDEVRDPETRWLYVRENNEFKNIVEEIRKEIDSKQESTKTFQSVAGFTGVNSSTVFEDTISKTKTDIVFDQQEENTQARDAEIVNETIAPPVENIPQIKMMEKAKLYGVITDDNVQEKIGSYSRRLKMIAASIVILLATAIGSYYYYQHRTEIKREEELITQVKRLKALGLKEQAAEKYVNLPPLARQHLLPLLLQIFPTLQKVGAASIDDLKDLKTSDLTQDQLAYMELISFWNAVRAEDPIEAQNALLRANVRSPALALIKENEAWLNYKNSPTVAYEQFKSLFKAEGNGRYLYGMLLSFVNFPAATRTEYARELLTLLERYTLVFFDLKKELLLGQIYLSRLLNEENIYQISLKQFFNTPTMLSEQFNRPDLLIADRFNWTELKPVVDAIRPNLQGDQAVLFEMHNLLESGMLSDADLFLKSSMGKLADIQIFNQMSLMMLHAQGHAAQVLAVGKASELSNSELTSFILAYNQVKVDAKKNIGNYLTNLSAKEYVFYKEWLELEQLKSKDVPQEIKAYLQDHFITSDNFKPVLEARNLIEQ